MNVDIQTLHRGHVLSMMQMRMTCGVGILGIGSVKQFNVEGHPFTFEDRVEMVRAIFGDAFRFVPLDDIDATIDKRDWYAYVLDKIRKADLPVPTDYFCGSLGDASWYTHAFADPAVHPSFVQGPLTTWTNPEEPRRRLHVLDRTAQDMPSGRDIRLMIEFRDPTWKRHVPELLHTFVERRYPPHLRQPLHVDAIVDTVLALLGSEGDVRTVEHLQNAKDKGIDILQATEVRFRSEHWSLLDYVMLAAARLDLDFPVGTRLSDDGRSGVILELKDDGKWRPLRGMDEKTAHALENRRKAGLS
jgi:hypothetical protein